MLVLLNRELVHREPVVVRRLVEVDHPRLGAPNRSVGPPVLHVHAVHEHPMHGVVLRHKRRAGRARQLAERVLDRLFREVGIKSDNRCAKPSL